MRLWKHHCSEQSLSQCKLLLFLFTQLIETIITIFFLFQLANCVTLFDMIHQVIFLMLLLELFFIFCIMLLFKTSFTCILLAYFVRFFLYLFPIEYWGFFFIDFNSFLIDFNRLILVLIWFLSGWAYILLLSWIKVQSIDDTLIEYKR